MCSCFIKVKSFDNMDGYMSPALYHIKGHRDEEGPDRYCYWGLEGKGSHHRGEHSLMP